MQTDRPTVKLYFVFAFTNCALQVYAEEEAFARRVLKMHQVEFLTAEDNESWQEIDTRVLLNLVADALPGILKSCLPKPGEIAAKIVGGGDV